VALVSHKSWDIHKTRVFGTVPNGGFADLDEAARAAMALVAGGLR
jgi:hypothetical protein